MTDSKSVGLIPRVGSSPTTGTSSEIPINAPFPPCGENCALMGISSLSAATGFAGLAAEEALMDRRGKENSYQMYSHNGVKAVGGMFFGCWWLFMTYMIFSFRKEGAASYVIAYGFFAFGTLVVIHTLCDIARTKFIVTDRTVTRYFPFAPSKTYDIREITKVTVHRGRSGIQSYRVYVGKRKVFELDDTMVNLSLFIETLQKRQVLFEWSVF